MNRTRVVRSAYAAARGFALFVGVFGFANSVGSLFGRGTENLWWVDASILPGSLSSLVPTAIAVVLVVWAAAPTRSSRGRYVVAACCTVLAALAAFNSGTFYRAWSEGRIEPAVGAPFSAVLAGAFIALALLIGWGEPPVESRRGLTWGVVGWTAAFALLFPLAHVSFFGTTDYRRTADAIVVLGARVHENGMLSSSLRDRVDAAVGLHEEGLAPLVIMSGGIDDNGTDEAAAMAQYAIARGVPQAAIEIDYAGENTDATVRNTIEMLGSGARVMAVSQFYHLPRIKMAFRLAGEDVATVPAPALQPIPGTPAFVAREIPAFWVYWLRGLLSRRA
ncbi:MAG: YdcF family protein [Coriobacteriia bacterium]|nr:YdcF family protein [Coriobacteriia bacterium]